MYIKRSANIGGGQVSPQDLSLHSLFSVPPSYSGERVTRDTILSIPSNLAAIQKIASTIARCSVYPYHLLENEGKEVDKDHWAYWLLNWKANSWQRSNDFIYALVADSLLGDGYAVKRMENTTPSVHNLDYDKVTPIELSAGGVIEAVYYAVNDSDGRTIYNSDEIIHLRNMAFGHTSQGWSLVQGNKTAIGLNLAQYKYSATVFSKGQHSRKTLSIPGWATPEQAKQIVEAIQNKTGLNDAHGVDVVMGGAKLESMPEIAKDAQLNEQMASAITDSANLFNMSGYFIGAPKSTSYGSIEADTTNYHLFTIDPILNSLEKEFESKLLGPRQQGVSHTIEFDRASLYENNKEYEQRIVTLFQAGLYSWEQAAARLSLPTKKKGEYVNDKNDKEEQPQQPQQPQLPLNEGMPHQSIVEDKKNAPANPAEDLARAALDRIKGRFYKSVENKKYDLSSHTEIIRSALPGTNHEILFENINNLQTELDSVLPEQRTEAIKGWNTECLAKQILR